MSRKTLRQSHRLTADEAARFNLLLPQAGVAFPFWRLVAERRGLDYKSIIGNPDDRESFTALPVNHKKDWCYPAPLKCARPPFDFSFANTGQPA